MSLDDAARYRGAGDAAGGSREASAHERRWAASFAAGYAVLWMVSPGYPAAGIVTFLLSLGLLVCAMRRVAALEAAPRGGEPGLIDNPFAGGLMASLLWNASVATGWISENVVPDGSPDLLLPGAASLVTILLFLCFVVLESIVSYVALLTVGAGRTDMAAHVAFALHVEAKFGGLAGRLRR